MPSGVSSWVCFPTQLQARRWHESNALADGASGRRCIAGGRRRLSLPRASAGRGVSPCQCGSARADHGRARHRPVAHAAQCRRGSILETKARRTGARRYRYDVRPSSAHRPAILAVPAADSGDAFYTARCMRDQLDPSPAALAELDRRATASARRARKEGALLGVYFGRPLLRRGCPPSRFCALPPG